MNMAALISKMVSFVALMGIGYFCVRKRVVSEAFTKDASKLVVNLFVSASAIYSVSASDISLTGGELAIVLLTVSIAMVIGYPVGYLAGKLIPVPKENRPQLELLVGVPNAMFVGLPVLQQLFGGVAVFYCALSCIAFNLALYTYGVSRLMASGSGEKLNWKSLISVPMVASVAALLIFILKLQLPQAAKDLLGSVNGATVPLSMLVIGASFGHTNILDSFKDWRMYLACLIKLIMLPLLMWVIAGLLTDDAVLRMTATVLAGCPSAILVTVLSIQYGRDPVYSSRGILLSTLLSMVTIPLLVRVLMGG